jgi:Cof subfamily protein (haloacid dehalogenase superfamily)
MMHEKQSFSAFRHFPYRLAAIDIDDTLVGPDKLISKANKRAVGILRTVGMRVVLASGRSHPNMLPFHRVLGLDDYVVSANGALVTHGETEEVLYRQSIPQADARMVIAEGLERDATVFCFGEHGVYAQRADRWTYEYQLESNALGLQIVDMTHDLPESGLLKVTWAAEPEVVAEWAADVAGRYMGRIDHCITSPHYLEFASPGADKAAGVGAVARRYGLSANQVIAFGDGNNDVSLLRWAGLGVAMADGRPAAKAAANRVAPPGDPETSLSRAVHELLGLLGDVQSDAEVA